MKTLFAKTHEWAKIDGDVAEIGITDYAADELGDIVYVSLPEVGAGVNAGEDLCEVESVKTASALYAPVSGEVIEVNDALDGSPELINESAMTTWICKIKADFVPADLMEEDDYRATL